MGLKKAALSLPLGQRSPILARYKLPSYMANQSSDHVTFEKHYVVFRIVA